MTILAFTDQDDDGVAIESSAIVAVSVGRLSTPRALSPGDHRDPLAVTIVHTLAGPLLVSQDPTVVVRMWREANAAPHAVPAAPGDPALQFYPTLKGWVSEWFNPAVLRPEVPAPWAPKEIAPIAADEVAASKEAIEP